MADNFDLRQFLTENKLTKNAKLLKEAVALDRKPVDVGSIEIDNIDISDYPDFSDAYITYAEYEDGTPLSEDELMRLEDENYGLANELIHDRQMYMEAKEYIGEGKSYKTSANSKEAQYLKKGDIIGSGDEVVSVSAGAKTPSGKVEVTVKTKDGKTKTNTWGKTTKVGVKQKETVKENTMADNFDLRQFLAENKLTKNTQLLKEGDEATQGTDISGYWVMYGEPNKGIQQFIKMFPSEEEAQQALQDAPTTYGQHVLRSNWGIESVQDWLATGGKIGPDLLGHPDRVPPKRLSPEERAKETAAFNQMRQDLYEGVEKKETVKENTMTQRDKYLTRLVENALGIHPSDDDEIEFNPADAADERDYRRDQYLGNQMEEGEHEFGTNAVTGEPLPDPKSQMVVQEDEMVAEKPLPKYENIEKLMQEIDKNTDEEAHKFKMQEMKRVADMLEKKCTALEEGDDADHIDQKKLKQMKKDIMTLRKGIEKMEKLGDKKFTKKETKAELKEGFDLKKFLVENKLTKNAKLLAEGVEDEIAQAFSKAGVNLNGTTTLEIDAGRGQEEKDFKTGQEALNYVKEIAQNSEGVDINYEYSDPGGLWTEGTVLVINFSDSMEVAIIQYPE